MLNIAGEKIKCIHIYYEVSVNTLVEVSVSEAVMIKIPGAKLQHFVASFKISIFKII